MSKSTDTQLLSAIEEDNYEALLNRRITESQSITFKIGENKTETMGPMFTCAAFNAYECFMYLSTHGLNYDAEDSKGFRPIHIAAEYGSIEVFSYIMGLYKKENKIADFFKKETIGSDPHTKVLYRAATRGVLDIYKIYSQYGFDFSDLAKKNKHIMNEICKKLSSNPQNDPDTIVFFLNQIQVNEIEGLTSDDKSPLMQAIIHSIDEKVITILVKHVKINDKDKDGKTAFHYACHFNNHMAAKLLIEKEIGESMKRNGFYNICCLRDIHVAKRAFEKYSDILKDQFYRKVDDTFPIKQLLTVRAEDDELIVEFLKLLMSYGYDPNAARAPDCPTVLECILTGFSTNMIKTIEFLLQQGVSFDHQFHLRRDNGRNALKKLYNTEIMNLRKKYGIT